MPTRDPPTELRVGGSTLTLPRGSIHKLTWSALAHTGCQGFGKWKARPRMPPALTAISLHGPFSKPEIHRSKRRWRDIHPSHPQYVYWCFTSFASSVFCNWSSAILWLSQSHFPDIFPSLELKYFFCSFNPIIPIYSPLNYPVCSFLPWSLCLPLLLNSLLKYLNYHFILFYSFQSPVHIHFIAVLQAPCHLWFSAQV